ncbi:MAG: efflux RND transporter periplasmic adaptor subunit [Acidobacteriota bacterium]
MSARIRPFAVVAVASLVFLVACGHEQGHHAEADLPTLQVAVADVQEIRGPKPIEVRGVVQPARQATLSSRIMGPVIALEVRAGDIVAKDQTLLEIQPEMSEGQLNQAQGALAQAKAALALAERNYKRFEALHAEKAASDLEFDMAQMQLDQARGAVTQAQGAVRTASSFADDSVVRAPFAARVVSTMVEVGDLVAPGRPLMTVESLEGYQMWLTVREADSHRVALGQEVEMQFDARPELGTITDRIVEIVPSADPATHTFTVKVALPDIDVRSGLSGRALLPGDEGEYIAVPSSAVHHRGGLELVILRDDDGTARTRAVTTGQALPGDRVEILSGLKAGDMVVVDAPGPVADGTPLEIAS